MAEFGVLTMATQSDCLKAVGLALSLKKHNPGVEIAIACHQPVADRVGKFFDYVVPQRQDVKGFEHKVYLDEYSPFEKTFFFDADILVFKNLQPIYEQWRDRAYTARGGYVTDGISSFGLDHKIVLEKISKTKLVKVGGAGHGYFEKPACTPVFELARKITKNYTDYANPCLYADEDVIAIAMTMLDLAPMSTPDFQGRMIHAEPGTIKMDVTQGICEYKMKSFQFDKTNDLGIVHPYMVHFAMREAPFLYRENISKLFKENNLDYEFALWQLAFSDWYWEFKRQLRRLKRKILN